MSVSTCPLCVTVFLRLEHQQVSNERCNCQQGTGSGRLKRSVAWNRGNTTPVYLLRRSNVHHFVGGPEFKRFQFMPKFDCKEGLSCLSQIGGKATHFKTLGVFTGHCICTQTFWETRSLRRSAREIAWKTMLLHCTVIKFVQVQRSIQ